MANKLSERNELVVADKAIEAIVANEVNRIVEDNEVIVID